jgi:predicted metalloprotease
LLLETGGFCFFSRIEIEIRNLLRHVFLQYLIKTNFMLWRGRRESSNVDDRRGIGGGGIAVGGGILGVIALLINYFIGGGGGDGTQLPIPNQGQPMSAEEKAAQDQQAKFVKVVLAETEDVWTQLMQQAGRTYTQPTLVLFTGSTQSACGYASSATGPFYCPGDQQVYIDLSFYDELKGRFGAPGDFAMAYVIAHEIGHHIQKQLGISDKIDRLRQQLSEGEFNKYSVRLELQADFLAGVWAHYEQGKGILERGDIEEALNAANAIGDDRLQREAQGYVVPESFTHGSSEQRMYWFKKGYETGDMNQGNTFEATDLSGG